MYVSCTREVITKFIKQISGKFRAFIQAFGPQLSIFFYFVSVRSFLNENLERKKILEKVTPLAHIFTLATIIFNRTSIMIRPIREGQVGNCLFLTLN